MQGGVGRGGSKNCKPIPVPPRGAGLKSRPIPAPLPLWGGENPHGAKRGGAGQAGRGKIAILNCMTSFSFWLPPHLNLVFMSNYYVIANLKNLYTFLTLHALN